VPVSNWRAKRLIALGWHSVWADTVVILQFLVVMMMKAILSVTLSS